MTRWERYNADMKYVTKISISLLIVSFLFIALPSFASIKTPEYVKDISDRKYFIAVLDAINNAKESVVIAMYYIAYDPANKDSKPNQLVQALINAHKRGCKVKVYLDRTGDIEDVADDTVTDMELLKKTKNVKASSALKVAGIEVIPSYKRTLNAKTVVIDKEIVIIGSTNWSEGGLSKNWELNSMLISKDTAESILSNLQTLESQITPNF